MNAMLIFDPGNDLVFAKTSVQFKRQVCAYATTSGLISSSSSSSSTSFSTSSISSSSSSSDIIGANDDEDDSNKSAIKKRCSRQQQTKQNHLRQKADRRTKQQPDDSARQYLDVLRLLLTPYVATLRLRAASAALRRQHHHQNTFHQHQSHSNDNNKHPTQQHQHQHQHHQQQEARFSDTLMPVACLADCQVVYECDEFDFMFVGLEAFGAFVSSARMRALQRRVEIFAQLAGVCAGAAPQLLRSPHCLQTQLLRRALDSYANGCSSSGCSTFTNKYNASSAVQFLVEAPERLLLGADVSANLTTALQQLLAAQQLHQQTASGNEEQLLSAHLFACGKLAAQFACRGAQLAADDQMLLVVLARAYAESCGCGIHVDSIAALTPLNQQQNQKQDRAESTDSCYQSNYSSNKRTYEIVNNNSNVDFSATTTETTTATTKSHKQSARRRRKLAVKAAAPFELPAELLVFMRASGYGRSAASTQASFSNAIRVPHLLRFVSLGSGVFVAILSCKSSAMPSAAHRDVGVLLCSAARAVAQLTRCSYELGGKLRLEQLARVSAAKAALATLFFADSRRATSAGRHKTLASWLGRFFGAGGGASTACATAATTVDSKQVQHSKDQGCLQQEQLESQEREEQQYQQQQQSKQNQSTQPSCLYACLERDERKLVRQLLSSLGALCAANANAYARQIFGPLTSGNSNNKYCSGLSANIDNNTTTTNNKTNAISNPTAARDALLGAVASTIREAFDALVVQRTLGALSVETRAERDARLCALKALAQHALGDYVEFVGALAARGTPLGAPLSHDMPSLQAFAYVDRSRQEALVAADDDNAEDGEQVAAASGAANWAQLAVATQVCSGEQPAEQRSQTTNSDPDSDLESRGYHDDLDSSPSSTKLNLNNKSKIKQSAGRALAAFVKAAYTQLAEGKTSQAAGDGNHVYTYFLWFETSSGGVLRAERRQKARASRELASSFSSLPGIVGGDFFGRLATLLFSSPSSSFSPVNPSPSLAPPAGSDSGSSRKLASESLKLRRLKRRNSSVARNLTTDQVNGTNKSTPQLSRAASLRIEHQQNNQKHQHHYRHQPRLRPQLHCYELFCVHSADILLKHQTCNSSTINLTKTTTTTTNNDNEEDAKRALIVNARKLAARLWHLSRNLRHATS